MIYVQQMLDEQHWRQLWDVRADARLVFFKLGPARLIEFVT